MTTRDDRSLYEVGWRQGSFLAAELPLCGILEDGDGGISHDAQNHGLWLVVSQDCDLDKVATTDQLPRIEVRPVFEHGSDDGPPTWGIKSKRLKLDDTHHLDSDAPHVHLSPAALTVLTSGAASQAMIDEPRLIALKTWLGLRYRRPAVPVHIEDLARAIARGVERHKSAIAASQVHEVLFQVDDEQEPYHYSLFAVVQEKADIDDVRAWLAEVALEIAESLGVADQVEAYTKTGVSLHLIETSYTANASDITWRGGPEPKGAA